MCFDTRYNLFYLTSNLYLRTQKFFGFFHSFAGNDLTYLELHFSKLLKCNLRFCLDVDHFFFLFRCFFCYRRMKFLYLFHHFIDIQSCKQDLRLIRNLSISELCEDLFRCLRHEGFQNSCSRLDTLNQIVKYGLQTVSLSLVLCKCPWHRLINVLVAAFEEVEDLGNRICHTQILHFCICLLRHIFRNSLQICIYSLLFLRISNTFICYHASKILIGHGNRSVYQISQCICKVRVHTLNHQFPGNHTIIFKRHLVKHEITHCIHTKEIYQLISIQYIALGFTHLAVTLQQPRMSEHLLRKRKIQCHQEDRPVNCMETDNVFSDQVQICRPVLLKLLSAVSVTVISDSGNVVGQRIQPYINHMLRIKIYRNSPFE